MTFIIAAFIIAAAFICGCILFKKLDRFLTEDLNAEDFSEEGKKPSCVILEGNISDDDLLSELSSFRNDHKKIKIVIYDTESEVDLMKE